MTASDYLVGDGDWDDPALIDLLRRSAEEVLPLYAEDDLSKQRVAPLVREDVVSVSVVRRGEEVVAAGVIAHVHDAFEVKRLTVASAHRRRGLARIVLRDLERRAAERGIVRLRLQTGFRQDAAIALYESESWHPIAPFGPYSDDDLISRCFEKEIA
ncbi:GNAT family N-acetyltransferase [Microbacterium betulae]|uniref:GNAT family N-acetyltransferase n=1 Tax=Microbacterium betulae TaxID=2981139 RepID=A0AA97I682_9MICO|nr:GNAT family N-acetyltransferase [Microbacterium sp. AB]WOF22352.1 GNAT family N-acetyltransferase [Microbacterium sp. AB]